MRPLYYRFRRQARRPRADAAGPPGAPSGPASLPPLARPVPSTMHPHEGPSPRMQDAAARLRRGERDVELIATLTEVPPALVTLMKDDLLMRNPPANAAPATAAVPCRWNGRARTRLLLAALALSVAALGGSLSALVTAGPALGYVGAVAAVFALLSHRLAARTRR